jgi:hypothetical protein
MGVGCFDNTPVKVSCAFAVLRCARLQVCAHARCKLASMANSAASRLQTLRGQLDARDGGDIARQNVAATPMLWGDVAMVRPRSLARPWSTTLAA